ncbi:DUF4832 domain-containing protein [Aeoliella sp. SH292]|uniref:DUF4832 domain-containing protein n=1 Tax=Aeoliella sp. SH292 TaxID=3454464 RepID=UPI003F95F4B6
MSSGVPVLRTLLVGVLFLVPIAHLTADEVIVRPRPADGPLDNPLKGWCPYPNAASIHQPYSMVFKYISWRELEPAEGDFRFDEWEKSWDSQAAKDKHILFRVYVDYPKKPSGLPDWLRKAGVKESAYEEYGGGESPDYDDPQMIAGMERLIAALGNRYNDNPRVAFIQLGLLGFWGEWHTYPHPKLYASPETERRIVDAYKKAFPAKSLMVRYARGYAGQQEGIGFHDDMFPEDTDNGKDWSFLAGLRNAKRTENWKVAVLGGEMVPGKANHWLGDDFDTTLTMLTRSHLTWVGPYCPALERTKDAQFRERSEQLIRKMGYEFQITEVTHPATVNAKQAVRISLKGKNNGVAPFYYPWSMEWVLLDSSDKVVSNQKTEWDIRRWKPGEFAEQAELAFDVPAGKYRLGLGIRDPWKDRPAIRFANDIPVTDGWTTVSEVRVSN